MHCIQQVGKLNILPIWKIIKYKLHFHPNGYLLNIVIKKLRIIEHRFPCWIKQFCNLFFLLCVICSNPICCFYYFRPSSSLQFTIESKCNYSIRVVFSKECLQAIIHQFSQVVGPFSHYKRSITFTSMIPFCYKTCNIIVYKIGQR